MNFLTKNIRLISILIFAIILSLGLFLSQYNKETKRTFFCFDTLIDITLSGKNADIAADEIESVLLDMEKTYSKYRSDSAIFKFNSLATGEILDIPDEMAKLIQQTLTFSQITDGAFDITTSSLSDLWQVKSSSVPPERSQIKKALQQTGYEKIKLKNNLLTKTEANIDFGGVLKGMAADKVRTIATKHGITSGIINLGGNVCLVGSKSGKPWTVGIVNPFSPSEVYLTVNANDTNVITSGAYQRYFEYEGKTYHHILSPKTGCPAETDVASATVISNDGALADALATAIFVLGSERGMEIAKKQDTNVIIIKKDGSVIATEGINYILQN